MSLVILGAVLLLCLLPSLVFLGFWHGLVAMQRRPLLARVSTRFGSTAPVITWADVIDAYADPQKRLVGSPPESHAPHLDHDRCSVCEATNDSVATFCRRCLRKLE